jgi:hypothetical protein
VDTPRYISKILDSKSEIDLKSMENKKSNSEASWLRKIPPVNDYLLNKNPFADRFGPRK